MVSPPDGGQIVLLPFLHTGSPDEDEEEEDYDYVYEEVEDEADAPKDREDGDDAPPDADEADLVLDVDEKGADDGIDADTVDAMVVEWVLALSNSKEIVWPEWADAYKFQTELDRQAEIAERAAAIAELQVQFDELNDAQQADQQWKLLVVGTGTPFEEAVAAGLTQLGFELEPTVPGRTDLRGTYDNISVVVETKGVTKSAAESHCAQLEKWVAEDLEAGRKSKGILVINAWLGLPPLERNQVAFPPQMRPYAELRNHSLVSGLQLLNLVRVALAHPERKDELARLLLDTAGALPGWENPRDAFAQTPPPPKKTARARKATASETD